jgi:ATP-dependent RNA helicase RhlE
MIPFSDLGLAEPLQRAVRDAGYTHPTPIQTQSIPHLLAGRDLLGCARTGTGKTAAFGLPILQVLAQGGRRAAARSPRSLVLVPTRELASQVAQSFRTYGKNLQLSVSAIFGGVGQGTQVQALARGIDILVATPGRLLDLMQQGHVKLDQVEILVLDEADHMLDLGFIPDVRRVLAAVPRKRQTLFFSATMPPPIHELARRILSQPVQVQVTPPASTVEQVEQRVHHVAPAEKPALLAQLLRDSAVQRALVFTRTKRGADRVARQLVQDGIPAQAIHGNKSQGARERTMHGFRGGKLRVLVATDIAARGIDVDDVTHVFNYDLPSVPETYVHRIGRTARAGAPGVAISLCAGEERAHLRDIERLIRRELDVVGAPAGAGSRAAKRCAARAPQGRRSHGRRKPARPERAAGSRNPGAGQHAPAAARSASRPVSTVRELGIPGFGAGLA